MKIKMCLLFLISFVLSGCDYYVWHNENYTYEDGRRAYTYGNTIPASKSFSVAGAEFNLVLRAENHTKDRKGILYKTTATGPYKLIFLSSGIEGNHEYAQIDSIKLSSSIGKTHSLTEEIKLPIRIRYEREGEGQNVWRAKYYFESPIDLDFLKNEELTINITVTIKTRSLTGTKNFSIKYLPYLDSGSKIVGPTT